MSGHINIPFLEQFEEYLRQENHTMSDPLSEIANTNIIMHYK
jgi:hypothetical protein